MLWRYIPVRSRRRPAGFITPAQPTLAPEAPSGPNWAHEVKFDGFRILAVKRDDKVRLWSRNGWDFTTRFPAIATAIAKLPPQSVTLDGEAVVLRPDGYSDFEALFRREAGETAALMAFDLLRIGEIDVRQMPLSGRRAMLDSLLGKKRQALRISETLEGDGPEIFRHASKLGLEGIVSKRIDKPYPNGRTKHWLKIKSESYSRGR